MSDVNRLPMPGLECLWHEGQEVVTLKSASAIIRWGDRGWVLRQAFQDECEKLRARIKELEYRELMLSEQADSRINRIAELERENKIITSQRNEYRDFCCNINVQGCNGVIKGWFCVPEAWYDQAFHSLNQF